MERPKIALRPDERMLLNALLSDEEVRAEILRPAASNRMLPRASHRGAIFQAALSLVARRRARWLSTNLHAPSGRGRPEPAGRSCARRARQRFRLATVAAAMDSMRRSQERGLRDRIEERASGKPSAPAIGKKRCG